MNITQYDETKLCRICLTKSAKTICLKSPLRSNEKNETSKKPLSILSAFEQVMSQKLLINAVYPSMICPMCKSLLTIAYDLNILFFNSQKTLSHMFKDTCKEEANSKKTNEVSTVDLIIGTQKFNLDDVLIIEDEKEENQHNFEGFLKNLGTTVSAVFVRNSNTKSTQKDGYENNSDERAIQEESQTNKFEHISYSQSVFKAYKCNYCDKIYASNKGLTLHMKTYHTNNLKETVKLLKVKQYLCDICGHLAYSSQKANDHRLTHFGKLFECPICHRKFSYKISLQFHKKTHKSNRDYLCSLCGKTFLYSNALVYHMRMHTNERNFICNFCDRKFYMQSTWKRHLRIHTNDRPYICTFCDKGFRSNGEKKKHEMIHTGLKPHKCQFCEKRFSSKYNQLVHHMSHSGDHGCDYCQRTFIDVEFLKRHIKNKHKYVEEPTVTYTQ